MFKTKGIPHPTKNRKDWMEKHLVAQKNKEEASRQEWDSTAKYFQNCSVKTNKYAHLSSPQMYQQSMDAYQRQLQKEEREKHLDVKIVNSKLTETWNPNSVRHKQTNPIVFNIEEFDDTPARVMPNKVTDVNPSPIPIEKLSISDEVDKPKEKKEMDSKEWQRSCERAGGDVSDPSRQRIPTDKDCELPQPEKSSINVVQSVRKSERESSSLKLEYSEMWDCLQVLRDILAQRSTIRKNQPRVSWSWQRPYKVLLQISGRNIIKELEYDIYVVSVLKKKVNQIDNELDLTNRLDQTKLKLQRDIQQENDRLWGIENLFQEEAEHLWFVRTAEWKKEEEERDSIIEKFVRLVDAKVQSRLSKNLELQRSNITSREELLTQMQ
ncbi:hypothetical protein CHUAL_005812 [Chamberlinius hualienensis]